MIFKIFDLNFFCRRRGLSWCTILLFAVVPLKPNCFWTIIHRKFPHGVGEESCCSQYFTIVFAFIFVAVTISTQICFKANKETASNKKHFASIALPELILSLSDMLTDFSNKIEHSFSVSVLTCMWHAKCLQMVNHSVFQQEPLTNHSAPDGSKSPCGCWSVSPRAEFFKAGLMRDLNSDLKASKAFQF